MSWYHISPIQAKVLSQLRNLPDCGMYTVAKALQVEMMFAHSKREASPGFTTVCQDTTGHYRVILAGMLSSS